MILATLFQSFDEAFSQMTYSAVGITQRIAMLGIVIFIIVETGMVIVKFFIGQGDRFPSFEKVFAHIVLFFFLISYAPVMKTFDSLIGVIEGYIRTQGETNYATIARDLILVKNVKDLRQIEQAEADPAKMQEAHEAVQGTWEKVKARFANTVNFFTFSVPALLAASIADGLTAVVRYLVEILSILLAGVLIILGPFAVMFETSPLGDGVLKNWFSSWLSIKCWGITMSIVDLMMHKFLILFTAQKRDFNEFFTEDLANTGVWIIVMNLAFVILFIMTPLLTGYYIKGSGGAIFSKAISTATTVAYAAIGASTMSAGGALGGAKELGNFQQLGERLETLRRTIDKQTKSHGDKHS